MHSPWASLLTYVELVQTKLGDSKLWTRRVTKVLRARLSRWWWYLGLNNGMKPRRLNDEIETGETVRVNSLNEGNGCGFLLLNTGDIDTSLWQ